MRTRYLAIYRQNLMRETRLFHGIAEVVDALDAQKLPWGIVTNKPGSLTEPLLELAGLAKRVACLVSGDSIARRKPYPDPLLHAAAHCKVDARACAYVGDAERDVQSAHAAGMLAVVALYGYLGDEDRPDVWKPDHMIKHPSELLAWLATRPAPRTVAETGT